MLVTLASMAASCAFSFKRHRLCRHTRAHLLVVDVEPVEAYVRVLGVLGERRNLARDGLAVNKETVSLRGGGQRGSPRRNQFFSHGATVTSVSGWMAVAHHMIHTVFERDRLLHSHLYCALRTKRNQSQRSESVDGKNCRRTTCLNSSLEEMTLTGIVVYVACDSALQTDG